MYRKKGSCWIVSDGHIFLFVNINSRVCASCSYISYLKLRMDRFLKGVNSFFLFPIHIENGWLFLKRTPVALSYL